MLHSSSASITRDLKHCQSTCVCLNVSQSGQSLTDMPVLAEAVVQRTGVEGKPIRSEFKTTWEGDEGGTEGKLQGKVGRDMHGTALSAFDVQHNGTPCLFSASIPAH